MSCNEKLLIRSGSPVVARVRLLASAVVLLLVSLPAAAHDQWSVEPYSDPENSTSYRDAVIGGTVWRSGSQSGQADAQAHLFVRCSIDDLMIGVKLGPMAEHTQGPTARDWAQFRVDDEPIQQFSVDASTLWFRTAGNASSLVTELEKGRTLFVRFPQLYFDNGTEAPEERTAKTAEFSLLGAAPAIQSACSNNKAVAHADERRPAGRSYR